MATATKPKWPPERVFVLAHQFRRDGEVLEQWLSANLSSKDARFTAAKDRRIFQDTKITIREYRLVPRKSRKGKPVRLSAKSRNEHKPAKRRAKRVR